MNQPDIQKSQGRITELNGKTIVFPGFRNFSDLFHSPVPYLPTPSHTAKNLLNLQCRGSRSRFRVSNSLRVSRLGRVSECFEVKLTDPVIAYIKKCVLRVEWDVASFEVNVWNNANNEALVIFQHSLIIGSNYLAIIKSDTIPRHKWTEKELEAMDADDLNVALFDRGEDWCIVTEGDPERISPPTDMEMDIVREHLKGKDK